MNVTQCGWDYNKDLYKSTESTALHGEIWEAIVHKTAVELRFIEFVIS